MHVCAIWCLVRSVRHDISSLETQPASPVGVRRVDVRSCNRRDRPRDDDADGDRRRHGEGRVDTFFGLLFLVALVRAFTCIRRRDVALHREWMIRALSLGLAVATVRPIVGAFFATQRFKGLTPPEFFGIAFWLGFTMHLIAAEAWINHTRAPRSIDADSVHRLKSVSRASSLQPAREGSAGHAMKRKGLLGPCSRLESIENGINESIGRGRTGILGEKGPDFLQVPLGHR